MIRGLGDERLARAAARGDDEAFATLASRYRRTLLAYATSLVRDVHDAEDVVQATFLNALRALGDRQAPVRPWLFRIAHNEAISLLRRRRPATDIEAAGLATRSAAQHAEARAELRAVLDDLDRLTDRQRSALVLRELCGLSYDDVAGALETTPAAARQTVSAARLALLDQAQGRDTACADVRNSLAETDRRRLPRPVRAHLSGCATCQAAANATRRRRRTLRALVPLPGWSLLGFGGSGASVAGKVAIAVTVTTVGITAEATVPGLPVEPAPQHEQRAAVAHRAVHHRAPARVKVVSAVAPERRARAQATPQFVARVVRTAPRSTPVPVRRHVRTRSRATFSAPVVATPVVHAPTAAPAPPVPTPMPTVVATPAATPLATPPPAATPTRWPRHEGTPQPTAAPHIADWHHDATPTPTATAEAPTPTPTVWHHAATPTPGWHHPDATPTPAG